MNIRGLKTIFFLHDVFKADQQQSPAQGTYTGFMPIVVAVVYGIAISTCISMIITVEGVGAGKLNTDN